jgi:glycosyltransferase involved in cell wall biosynthesis
VQLPDMVDMDAACNKVGAVVIGRNEGERLRRCLQSLQGTVRHVVYVDSGSTDGSVALAAAFGATVFELDMRIPFNAGRARNEGVRRLGELHPELRYVLFVDGDCEVIRTWPARAAHFLDAHPDVAVVSGRLRERDPQRSVYNMLAANEWKAHPIGAALACGGNATMRIQALSDVGGYRLDLQSGEEPELCLRLRAAGWLIWFLPEDQAVHDAAMTRFSQFWRRSMRSGYGCMQGLLLHGGPPEFHCLRAVMSASFWALLVPLATLLLLPWLGVAALLLLLIYPLQMLRIALRDRRSREDYWRWGLFAVLIKFPNLQGQLQCLLHQFQRRKARLIEYKL